MRLATPIKASPGKTEQIILFRVSGQLFAVSSASVQEVRSADSMSGAATEISAPGLRKVRHVLRRGDRSLFIVNGAMHFGLHAAAGALIFVLRKTRTALLIDGIEKMATMTRLQALPLSFCREERRWYLMRRSREQIPRNDNIDRTRTAIIRPAPAGRAAVCRLGQPDCRTRCSEPCFSLPSPDTKIRRSDSASRTDRSSLRRFRNAPWETPHFAAFLLDRRAELRNTERMGRRTGYR